MSVSFKAIADSSCVKYFTGKVIQASESAAEFAFTILDGATTSLSRLLPDLRPKSISEVLQKTTEEGSALLITDSGDVLIEISKDEKGRRTFRATDDLLQSVVLIESKKRGVGVLWEAKVADYLKKSVSEASMVDYGVSARRWTGNKFADLKKHFILEGLLSKKGNSVILQLPDETLSFQGTLPEVKAEMALKHYYQRQKTPPEEIQGRPWDLLNKLFLGYLYFSGYALAPWIHDHVRLPHQVAQNENERADQMAADGRLDPEELAEMAKNPSLCQKVIDIAESRADQGQPELLSQLERVTFTQDGYTQTFNYGGTTYEEIHQFSADKETHIRTECTSPADCIEYKAEQTAEELILTQTKPLDGKTLVQKATFTKDGDNWKLVKEESYEERLRLPGSAPAPEVPQNTQHTLLSAATVFAINMLTVHDRKVALIASLITLLPRSEALSIPSFTPAKATPTVKKVEQARTQLDRRTDPITIITPLPDLTATPGVQLTENIDMSQYFELSNPNANLDLSIKQPSGAAAPSWISMNMVQPSLIKTFFLGGDASDMYIRGNYAFVALDNGLKIVDISNPGNPVVVGFWEVSVESNALRRFIYIRDNYAFYGKVGSGAVNPLVVLDISNPSNISLVKTVDGFGSICSMIASGNYLYITDGNGGGGTFQILDISNPTNPIQKSILSWEYCLVCIGVIGKYAYFATSDSGFRVVDISNPVNPVIVTSVLDSSYFVSAVGKDNYVFIAYTNNAVKIYDITQIATPVVVGTVYLGVSPSKLTLEGNYIYASCTGGGVKVINIENILNSQLVISINTFGKARDTFLSGNIAFIADGAAGLTYYSVDERSLSGKPALTDRGLLLLDVIGSDGTNAVVEPTAIHVGEINTLPIANQQVYVGNSTLFTLSAGTFEYPGAVFTYTATLAGGLPLPAFISFDPPTRTFIFAPRSGDQNTYRIEVKGNDGYGGSKTIPFDLSVPDRFPVLEQPFANQTAYTGEPFVYIFDSNTFSDLDKDILSYSAKLAGSNVLPGWLGFDSALRKFYGTPFGKGVYPIEVTANDGFGGTVSDTFTITVPNSAPIVLNPPGTQLASVGIFFSYAFNSNTFFDVDNDVLTYSTSQLPAFLSFNPATRTFSGTPQVQDIGTYSITLSAEDPDKAKASTTFSLTVLSASNNNPPVLIKEIPDVSKTAGVPFSFTFDAGTFEDPENQPLRYEASLEGGGALPEGLYFDSDTRTLSGLLDTPQSLRVTIRALDPSGAFALDTFTLNIVDGTQYPPIVLNPLPDAIATVGESFSKPVPDDTFKDRNGDALEITVTQSGGRPLPPWLKWNNETKSFFGKPGPFDTGTYVDWEYTIEVWASDSTGSTKSAFKLTVQGESFWETFLKVGITLGSIAVSGIGYWKSRALVWNYFRKEKYRKETERALIGQPFELAFDFDESQVKVMRAYQKGHTLSQERLLPDGLVYEDNKLQGKPSGRDKGRFTIQVEDHDGFMLREFDLIIKKDLNEDDPPIEDDYLKKAKAMFTSLSRHIPRIKQADEVEGGRSSTMMKGLLNDDEKK